MNTVMQDLSNISHWIAVLFLKLPLFIQIILGAYLSLVVLYFIFILFNPAVIPGFLRALLIYTQPNKLFDEKTHIKTPFNQEGVSLAFFFLYFSGFFLVMLIIAKYFVYLFFIRLFAMLVIIILFFHLAYVFCRYGYAMLVMIMLTIVMANLMYFSKFDMGFINLPSHASMWDGLIHNTTNVNINLNNFLYLFLLTFAYYSLAKYLLNFFWWRWCETPKTNIVEQSSIQTIMSSNQSGGACDSRQRLIEDLKLMGFSASAIALLLHEVNVETLQSLIQHIRTTDELSGSPKAFMMYQLFGESAHDLEKT